MSDKSDPIEDYVFSLSDNQFIELLQAADRRIDKERYGFTSFEEAARFYERKPACPY